MWLKLKESNVTIQVQMRIDYKIQVMKIKDKTATYQFELQLWVGHSFLLRLESLCPTHFVEFSLNNYEMKILDTSYVIYVATAAER